MFKWIAKRALPIIAANLVVDVDTIQKKDGAYLRVRVEAFNFKLLDRKYKVSESPEQPIDIFESGAKQLPDEIRRNLSEQHLKTLSKII